MKAVLFIRPVEIVNFDGSPGSARNFAHVLGLPKQSDICKNHPKIRPRSLLKPISKFGLYIQPRARVDGHQQTRFAVYKYHIHVRRCLIAHMMHDYAICVPLTGFAYEFVDAPAARPPRGNPSHPAARALQADYYLH